MTGKGVARARKDAAERRTKTMPRAAVRTGKDTASARSPVPAAKPATPKTPLRKPAPLNSSARKLPRAHKGAMNTPERLPHPNADADRERDARLAAMKDSAALRADDEDDLEWLDEEDDPRKQIVEDDEEWDAHHDEW